MIIIYIEAIIMRGKDIVKQQRPEKQRLAASSRYRYRRQKVRVGGLNINDKRIQIGNAVDIDGDNEVIRLPVLLL